MTDEQYLREYFEGKDGAARDLSYATRRKIELKSFLAHSDCLDCDVCTGYQDELDRLENQT